MATFLQQFGGSGFSASSITVPVPGGGIAAGHSLVISVVALTNVAPTVSSVAASDTSGNSYIFLADTLQGVTLQTTNVSMLYCNVTSALQAGDVITLTPDRSISRMAASVYEFDVVLTPDTHAVAESGDNTITSLVIGPSPTTAANDEIVVGAFALVNAGRTFTVGAGYADGTKVVTTAGSGERAIVAEYKFVSTTGPQTADGTLNSNGYFAGALQTFTYADAAARSGKAKVWDGTAWTSHSAKVWDGTAWVAHDMKGWNGTAWIKGK